MRSCRILAVFVPLLVLGCSEARSDIENLDKDALEAEADELSESANASVKEKVAQIQPSDTMTADNVVREKR